MRRIMRIAAAAAAAPVLLLGTAVPAMAEDCFNASRSVQGSTAAANAGTWWSVPEFLAVVAGLSADQVATVMPVINADPRVPVGFTVFYNPQHPGELASSMPVRLASNGHGIDHSDDYSTPVFQAIFEDVASSLA